MTRRFKRDDQLVLGHEIRKSCVEIVGTEEAAMPIADAEEIGRMFHGDLLPTASLYFLIPSAF